MDIYPKYKSPFGYETGDNGIDSYGVDHSGFSLRDEIEYQTARDQRESQLMQMYNNQGITDNYPQYTTNFWGDSGNNYGFGSSNISQNIGNVTNRLNNGANNEQISANSDYIINTESLVGKPSSYFQNNNSTGGWSNNTGRWGGNTGGLGDIVRPDIITDMQSVVGYNSAAAQKRAQILQAQRNAVNQILMNGMDVLYGMNRALNGMTFRGLDWLGNKFGHDTQINNYLQLKTPQERELAQTAGQLVEYGGSALTGGALAKYGLNQANMAYNGYKIGKKYDQLVKDPFQGSGSDVIARMKNHNGEQVILQRGEITRDPNGNIISSGKYLKENTGSRRNYGLDKGIYKHEVSRADAQRIPRTIQKRPVDTNEFGQNVYITQGTNGKLKVVTSPKDGENIISSMYYVTR